MKPGDLVRIVRPTISIPRGTLGLIIKDGSAGTNLRDVWYVELYGIERWPLSLHRRILQEDLELV